MTKQDLALIVAMTPTNIIGKDGQIPWKLSEDLKYFRRTTTGHAIIMGHKTYRSIGKALPKRRNIVLSRQKKLEIPDCEVYSNLQDALNAAYENDSCPFIIGGGEIYKEALPLATLLYITEVDFDLEGDTYFPKWNKNNWLLEKKELHKGYSFLVYKRK